MLQPPPTSTLFPYTTLFRSVQNSQREFPTPWDGQVRYGGPSASGAQRNQFNNPSAANDRDRKSTRLNSSHMSISYAVFCLKKKKKYHDLTTFTQSPSFVDYY